MTEPIGPIATMDLNDLNGPQRRVLRDALVDAFDEVSLDKLLQDRMNRKPLKTLVPAGSFDDMVFHLIVQSRMKSWTEQLIQAALAEEGGNARLKNLIRRFEEADAIGAVAVEGLASKHGGLERVVRDGGFADFGLWVGKMAAIGKQVCRVEYANGTVMDGGTGFLVAPDLVLTNYHVVEPQITGTLDPSKVTCRFDFMTGGAVGRTVALAAGKGWLVDKSPISPFDPGDQGGNPQPGEMDYALLRLAESLGDQQINGQSRGWIPMRKATTVPPVGEIVLIAQHPKEQALKLAIGAVLAENASKTRLRYDANTNNGSSGSPCLDSKLDLVALHHGGDPDYAKLKGDYNQGIPIGLIVQLMTANNVTPFWN